MLDVISNRIVSIGSEAKVNMGISGDSLGGPGNRPIKAEPYVMRDLYIK
jgi:hypothetical protein